MQNREHFNPKRLKEARLVRGLTIKEFSEEIDVTRQAISQFEMGESSPKQETMMKIIKVLNFPKNFFYKDFEEQYVGNTFFRANATATKKSKESQYNKTLMAAYIYNYLSDLIEFPELNLPDITKFVGDWSDNTIEELATYVRHFWGLGNSPITNVIHELEKNGIVVFTVDTHSKKVDAFAQHRKGKPFIFVGNEKDSGFRRQFDAAHELGHILMHKDIDNQDLLSREEYKAMEEQANKFASAFLLPEGTFKKTVTSTTLLHFIELKKYWHVSMAAMIYRSYEIGIIDESRYTSLQKQISMKKYRKREPLDEVFPVSKPTVLKRSIELLLDNEVTTGLDLIHDISLPQDLIEMLCGLEEETLNKNKYEAEIRLMKGK
ncbi:XRE family transcriptional regulator [Alkalibacillus haloalkaliphilus]|uniref:XRE family transcriptional regulator n=1 Tax=Alkalibacillus haloalkaliphilus TaxID=94136 RepID=UPI002935EE1B|nr:XRE family transcriptional regulator [Alkalibacillus haloalkaliphilus]MDV2581686.1 XRE family transcriptional regulator [Alkalibacillus haloalkaliphilus]